MLLSISFMIVFGARTATVDWGQMYLIEEKNQSQYVGMWYICLFCRSQSEALSNYNSTFTLCYIILSS